MQFWSSQFKKDSDKIELCEEVKGLEAKSHKIKAFLVCMLITVNNTVGTYDCRIITQKGWTRKSLRGTF